MSHRAKTFILALTVFLVVGTFLQTQFKLFSTDQKQFEVTANPQLALKQAQEKGEPVFLEFYANW